ncbi:hypothetical protein EB796_020931 [Bugula neritina]|uniref:Thioredoxin domain-containing protein n=1 Tax=Bugula neritina TaxID=10212 RepID=A0A7J7J3U0_BUGNE|nr:hypothetical protein EB796_020931 [Bugula neritina]
MSQLSNLNGISEDPLSDSSNTLNVCEDDYTIKTNFESKLECSTKEVSNASLDVESTNHSESQDTGACNFIMITFVAVCYFAIGIIPNLALLGSTTAHTDSVQSSIPSDGAFTIYQSAKPAEPFFPEKSVVYDSYDGELKMAATLVEEHGYVFVMYYASWSTQCMKARDEFEKAAQFMHGRVPFVAVNCWHPSSQCKSKYKFYSFPAFFVYASGMNMGFAFTGIERAHYFVRFMQSLLNPITHISNASQLINFVSNQESSLVGYFNLSKPEPAGKFQQFYYASLRSIEKDYIQPVRFGVLSDEKFASQYSMNEDNNLLLVRSVQENLAYPSNGNFTSSAITKWISKYKIKPLVSWLFPKGKKSDTLYQVLQTGPTLILFTPYDACSIYNRDLSLLREVILDVYSCNTSEVLTKKIATLIAGSKLSRQETPTCPLCVVCKESPPAQSRNCCYSIGKSSTVCQVCSSQAPCSGYCRQCSKLMPRYLSSRSSQRNLSCNSIKNDIASTSVNTEVCCGNGDESSRRSVDDYIIRHKSCSPIQCMNSDHESSNCISNLRLSNNSAVCSLNTTLNGLAVDSSLYTEFIDRVGVNRSLVQNHLVLIDIHSESYYLMKGKYNKPNIVKFLEEFGSGITSSKKFSPTHTVSKKSLRRNDQMTSVKDINNSKLNYMLSNQHIIKKDIVVLFHSKWCAHCKAVSHIFLSCARYLGNLSSIRFFRVDISTNTLDWKYRATKVPTVTYFTHGAGSQKLLLPLTNMVEMLTFVLQRCSLHHLIEMMTKSKDKTPMTLTLIRSRLTSIKMQLQSSKNYSNFPICYKDTEFCNLYSARIQSMKLDLLNLRKLYADIYRSIWLYKKVGKVK